jgi:hypothetical protein
MPLKFIEAIDLRTFVNLISSEQSEPGFRTSLQGSAPENAYAHSIDKIMVDGWLADEGTAGPSQDGFVRFGWDVLLADPGNAIVHRYGLNQTTVRFPVAMGDPNRLGGQKGYASDTGSFNTSVWEEVSLITGANSGVDAFPTVIPANGPIRLNLGIGDFASANSGGWVSAPGIIGGGVGIGWWQFFEGLTDGIPADAATPRLGPEDAETNALGSNVYPKGLALAKMSAARIPAPVGQDDAAEDSNALCWLDLDTGGLAGRMHLTPGVATNSLTEPNSEAPIAGNNFDWWPAQYIPDTDATAAQPKGELLLVSNDDAVVTESAFDNTLFLKVIDFNPFGKVASSAPNRVHERERLLSSVVFNHDPLFDLPSGGVAREIGSMRLFFHPPTRRFALILAVQSSDSAGAGPLIGESGIGYWQRAIDPVLVTSPVARDVPRTNDVIAYDSFVGGSLGEPVAAQLVDWTLFRNSTEGEILDASTFPGSSTVANFPIDDTSPSIPEGTLVVLSDGTILVEGVDYSVVLATGVITWITDQSGAALVTATYEHRTTDASPPHGSLLSAQSVSDGDGIASTQIRYDDNDQLVGKLDRIISEIA